MQVFTTILLAALAASMVWFATIGALQYFRRAMLARRAHEMCFQFSPEDLFDIPRRYAPFALVADVHSPHANNLTYGRVDGWGIRAFDFHCEVGHAARRVSRHYSVLTIETDRVLPSMLLWNQKDGANAPLVCRGQAQSLEQWNWVGDRRLAQAFVDGCRSMSDQGASLQTLGNILMVCLPFVGRRTNYLPVLQMAGQLSGLLRNAVA